MADMEELLKGLGERFGVLAEGNTNQLTVIARNTDVGRVRRSSASVVDGASAHDDVEAACRGVGFSHGRQESTGPPARFRSRIP